MSSTLFPSRRYMEKNQEINHVGVAGSGIMGTQLVLYFLSRGLNVTLYTRTPARAKISLKQLAIDRYPKMEPLIDGSQLTICDDIKLLCEAEIVIETIKEDLVTKRDFIKKIIETDPSVIIGSCTSSLMLKQITIGLEDSSNVQVIHFSNPVAKMKVIELVSSVTASEETKVRLSNFFKKLEHVVIEVPDIPGYVINSIIFAILEKANFLVKEYGLSREDIDILMKIGCGFPMGPFEIEQLIGVQTVELIKKNLLNNTP